MADSTNTGSRDGAGRRIMREFRITEISAVDAPAQEGAVVAIIKAAYGDDDAAKADLSTEGRRTAARSGSAMPDGSFPISTEADLRNAIQAFGRAKDKAKTARHIARRARAIGAVGLLPTTGELADLIGTSKSIKEHEGMTTKTPDERIAELEKALADSQVRIEMLSAEAQLSPEEREVYKSMDEAGRAAFLSMPAGQRSVQVRKAQEAKEVSYTALDGTTYLKSDDARLVAQARRADEAQRKLDRLADELADSALRKRAETELAHLPGDVDARVALLKATDAIADPAVRKAALGALLANNKAIGDVTKEIGAGQGKVDDGLAGGDTVEAINKAIDALVSDINKLSPGLTPEKAYATALATDKGRQLYAKLMGL